MSELDWGVVAHQIVAIARDLRHDETKLDDWNLNRGQRASLHAIATRLPNNGVVIADEVGMGKTRIAVAVAEATRRCGGRVGIVVPPGLGYQWQDELRGVGIETPPILRSLYQFLRAWEGDALESHRPWFNEKVVLVSHAFTNWRLGESAQPWRWGLLPELYALWRKHRGGRIPRGYHGNEKLVDPWVHGAAASIVLAASNGGNGSRVAGYLDQLVEFTPWPGALDAAEYARHERLRPSLERAVGLGLGVFDLLIVDEAHKSRSTDSGLSRLLEQVLVTSDASRRLGMTATPVELDATQWKSILTRVARTTPDGIERSIDAFCDAVTRVRQRPSEPAARVAYAEAARSFEKSLSPFLLRRDKRQDPAVANFASYTGQTIQAYRDQHEIIVDPTGLSGAWRQTICAAEALSIVVRQVDDPVAKRLRLTVGNGHGITALVDQLTFDKKLDSGLEDDGSPNQDSRPTSTAEFKRLERARWWTDVIARTVGEMEAPLLEHPALLAAVEDIERVCARGAGEKVLVFGRFTRPLQALVSLLNAREMLRSLREDRPWPQSKVADDEWTAVQIAHRQLQSPLAIDHTSLDGALGRQYQRLEQGRERFRNHLLDGIHVGMEALPPDSRAARIFAAFRRSVEDADDKQTLAVVAKAVQELLPKVGDLSPGMLAGAFADLVEASSERDEGDANGDGELDPQEAEQLWLTLKQRIVDEYDRPQGGFARLMYGGTRPETRRLLQLAFNRPQSYPKVLVAQSLVGREGLNLHRACKVVVLLHPEWNPGVVEQQIGRVDRVGSLWERRSKEGIANGVASDLLPRIEVRPVIFKGTYDESNWKVLQRRWNDLRAQLHGVVIPPHEAEAYLGMEDLVTEINGAAPNFSPTDDL